MADQTRVHNQSQRAIDYPRKGKKPGIIEPGRAVTMDEKLAKKYLKAYPKELIDFESLVVGGKKNLSKENARLESEVQTLNESFTEAEDAFWTLADENETLEGEKTELESAAVLSLEQVGTLEGEKQWLVDMVNALEKELEEATKPKEEKPVPPAPEKKATAKKKD